MTPRYSVLPTERMELPSTDIGFSVRISELGEHQDPSFRNVKLEVTASAGVE